MLSFTEYKKIKNKTSNQNIVDSIFADLENEVVYLHINPNRLQKLSEVFKDWANFVFDSKWKTIQEHRIISQLDSVIREESQSDALEVRKIINKYKQDLKEMQIPSIAHPETLMQDKINDIFQRMQGEIISTFGVSPQKASPVPSASPSIQQPVQKQPMNWKDRLKRWAKGLWYGPGDPRLRQFATKHGYSNDDYYSQFESVDALVQEAVLDTLLIESVQGLAQILLKYKQELIKAMKDILQWQDSMSSKNIGNYIKAHWGKDKEELDSADKGSSSSEKPEEPKKAPEEKKPRDMTAFTIQPSKHVSQMSPEELEKLSQIHNTSQEELPSSSEEPEELPKVSDEEEKNSDEEKTSNKQLDAILQSQMVNKKGRQKNKAYLTNVDGSKLTFADFEDNTVEIDYNDVEKDNNGIPISVTIDGKELGVNQSAFNNKNTKLLRKNHKSSLKTKEAEGYVEPEMSTEEKKAYVDDLYKHGKVKNAASAKFFKEHGKVHIQINGKKVPIEEKINDDERYIYFRTGKLKGPNERWFNLTKVGWERVSEEDPVPQVRINPELMKKFEDIEIPGIDYDQYLKDLDSIDLNDL